MKEVPLCVGRVDHQQVARLLKAVEICVVHRAAPFVGDNSVLGLIHRYSGHVAGEDVLKEGNGIRSVHQDAPHVGDVEKAAMTAGVQMLGHDLGRVFHGHLPAAKIHHGGPGGGVDVVELSTLEMAHKCVLLRVFSVKGKQAPFRGLFSYTGTHKKQGATILSRLCSLKPERFPEKNPPVAPSVRRSAFQISSRPSPFT